MKKMRVLSIFAAIAGLFLLANVASAINLPEYMEFDLDNWTRLYRQGDVLGLDAPPDTGDMSRAFITFNDISPTGSGFPVFVPDPGGPDAPATWVGGVTDGTYLHGWEDNVVITSIVPQLDGSVNLYFGHNPAGGWEFEVYQTGVSFAEFTAGPGYLVEGPTMFNTIQTNLSTHASSVPFIRGMFADSAYIDPVAGVIVAVASINIPTPAPFVVGGEWNNQVNTPYGLGVNAFVDVDATWGIGGQFQQNFYGFPVPVSVYPNITPYDLAIQNVRLNSELANIPTNDQEPWIVSDDGVRAARVIPEPATMLLLGTGLVGLGGAARRRKKKQA